MTGLGLGFIRAPRCSDEVPKESRDAGAVPEKQQPEIPPEQ